jgi:hypothetical protein
MRKSAIALIASIGIAAFPAQAQAEIPKEFGPWRQQLENKLWSHNDGFNPSVLKRFRNQTETQQLAVYKMAKTTCSFHRQKFTRTEIAGAIGRFIADNSDKPGFETDRERKELGRLLWVGHLAGRSTFCRK